MKTKFLDEYSCRNSQVDNKTPPFNSMDQVDNKTPQLNSMDKIDNKTPQFNSVDDETNDQLNSEPSQLPEKYPENSFSLASWPGFRAPTLTSKIQTE